MERLIIKSAIIVEGKYDKIRLMSVVDAPVFAVNGFSIFKEPKKLEMLRKIALEKGIIILTDSDTAGFKIRNYIYGAIDKKYVKNVYIPDVFGKEKRKRIAGAEGKIGVEGIDNERLRDILLRAGVCESEEYKEPHTTRIDLYEAGLLGKKNSADMRKKFLSMLDLPAHLSVSALLDMVNILLSRSEYEEKVKQLCENLAEAIEI